MSIFVRNLGPLFAVALMALGQPALAIKHKTHSRSTAPNEQFKAIDAGETIGIDNDIRTEFDENANKPTVKKEVSSAPPAVPTSALLPKDRGSFERVPNESKDSIAKRLKIIETLILEYGRAYDYRIHTTKELNAILEDLKKQTPPNNAPQSS